MSLAFLSLGSNLGNRLLNLKKALTLLSTHKDIYILAVSSVYETDPMDYKDQDDFLNLVCRIKTSLEPKELLDYVQTVENILLRERTIRFGPRTIDVDVLTYDNLVMNTPELTLPHPRMKDRDFVQIPLRQILEGNTGEGQGNQSVRYFCEVPDNCWLKPT